MRPVLTCVVMSACLVFMMAAKISQTLPSGLTVILDFKGAHSEPSIREMERESASILNAAGMKLNWRLRDQMVGEAYPDLVVMTFNGACKFNPAPPNYDETSPLASTKTTDHKIQPFGQVDCDHVVGAARAAMETADFARADFLIGRALGRVVVHEIVHMVTHSADHGRDGVFEAGLSGKQLIAPNLPLDAMDVNRLMSGLEGEQP